MLIISNHVTSCGMEVPHNAVIRVNIAWIKDKVELQDIIDASEHSIFLDYPTGRFKPPVPTLTLDEAIDIANSNSIVECFGVSNAEDLESMKKIREKLNDAITLIPKIETKEGVSNLSQIVEGANTNMIMLDKDDLYTNVRHNKDTFDFMLVVVKSFCDITKVQLLTLRGVIFSDE